MTLTGAVSGLHSLIWIVLGALLVIRVAIGVARRNRHRSAGPPRPLPTPTAVDALRPVAPPVAADRTVLLEVRDVTVAYGSEGGGRRSEF